MKKLLMILILPIMALSLIFSPNVAAASKIGDQIASQNQMVCIANKTSAGENIHTLPMAIADTGQKRLISAITATANTQISRTNDYIIGESKILMSVQVVRRICDINQAAFAKKIVAGARKILLC